MNFARIALMALVLTATLALAACGQQESGGSGGQDTGGEESVVEGTAEQTAPSTGEITGGMEDTGGMNGMSGMDQGGMDMGSEEMARGMLTEDGEYSDRRFIDMMVPHHAGAVEMAEVALENAEHREIRELAENIVAEQEAEIALLRDIKQSEFGTREVPMQMGSGEMQGMGMMQEPGALANEEPFDRAFIDGMIPHHESAIAMAQVALDESENPEIRDLSRNIVDSQEREISQMREWRKEWYPES